MIRRRSLGVVQRLLAEAVARQQQFVAAPVPDRDREHAVEALDRSGAVAQVGLQDDLGLAMGVESRAVLLEFAAQFAEVVDLAVEDQADLRLARHTPAGGRRRRRRSTAGACPAARARRCAARHRRGRGGGSRPSCGGPARARARVGPGATTYPDDAAHGSGPPLPTSLIGSALGVATSRPNTAHINLSSTLSTPAWRATVARAQSPMARRCCRRQARRPWPGTRPVRRGRRARTASRSRRARTKSSLPLIRLATIGRPAMPCIRAGRWTGLRNAMDSTPMLASDKQRFDVVAVAGEVDARRRCPGPLRLLSSAVQQRAGADDAAGARRDGSAAMSAKASSRVGRPFSSTRRPMKMKRASSHELDAAHAGEALRCPRHWGWRRSATAAMPRAAQRRGDALADRLPPVGAAAGTGKAGGRATRVGREGAAFQVPGAGHLDHHALAQCSARAARRRRPSCGRYGRARRRSGGAGAIQERRERQPQRRPADEAKPRIAQPAHRHAVDAAIPAPAGHRIQRQPPPLPAGRRPRIARDSVRTWASAPPPRAGRIGPSSTINTCSGARNGGHWRHRLATLVGVGSIAMRAPAGGGCAAGATGDRSVPACRRTAGIARRRRRWPRPCRRWRVRIARAAAPVRPGAPAARDRCTGAAGSSLSAWSSSLGNSRPLTSSSTSSRLPPTADAITGQPAAIASSTAFDMPSWHGRQHQEVGGLHQHGRIRALAEEPHVRAEAGCVDHRLQSPLAAGRRRRSRSKGAGRGDSRANARTRQAQVLLGRPAGRRTGRSCAPGRTAPMPCAQRFAQVSAASAVEWRRRSATTSNRSERDAGAFGRRRRAGVGVGDDGRAARGDEALQSPEPRRLRQVQAAHGRRPAAAACAPACSPPRSTIRRSARTRAPGRSARGAATPRSAGRSAGSMRPRLGRWCTGMPRRSISPTRNEGLRKNSSSGCQRERSSPPSRLLIWRWLPPTSISSLTSNSRLRRHRPPPPCSRAGDRLPCVRRTRFRCASRARAASRWRRSLLSSRRAMASASAAGSRCSHQHAVLIVLDQFRNARHARAHHRAAAGHRFHQRHRDAVTVAVWRPPATAARTTWPCSSSRGCVPVSAAPANSIRSATPRSSARAAQHRVHRAGADQPALEIDAALLQQRDRIDQGLETLDRIEPADGQHRARIAMPGELPRAHAPCRRRSARP